MAKVPKGKSAVKRAKLIKGVLAGKTGKQSAIDAGYAPKQAASQASQILNNPKFLAEWQSELRKQISPERIITKISSHLDAKKTVSAVSGKDAGAGSVDFVDVEDYQAQQKAIEQVFKIEGIGQTQKVDVEHTGTFSFEVISFAEAKKK